MKVSRFLSNKQWAGITGIIAILSFIISLNFDKNKIQGIVKDATNNMPIENVKVSSQGLSNIISPIYTDSEGLFRIELRNNIKSVKLLFTHEDYITYELTTTLTKGISDQINEIRLSPIKKIEEDLRQMDEVPHSKVLIKKKIEKDKTAKFFKIKLKILHKYVKKYGINKILMDGETIYYRERVYYDNMPSNAPEYFVIENVKEGDHIFSIADYKVHINICTDNQEIELTCD
ncbi:MAG: carboxypeptidase-like regulatory domain-containing protein [Alistipes senegalensis]|nr:carboxypeptidase-like regulatory domain-containing protein [Bacteroides cellulosilyticus]MCM1351731.1 carboxypeptidase-like regulatory domain-containing protein [Alistipes senegalensis]